MDDLIWKIKQLFRKVIPWAIIGTIAYVGFNVYRTGSMRRGLRPVTAVLQKVPVIGSAFRPAHKARRHSRSYAYSRRHGGRHGKKHGHRSKRHGRRHTRHR